MTTRRLVLLAALAIVPASAAAQQAPPSPSRPIELSLGGTFLGPSSAGSATASLITPGGGSLDVFKVDSTFGIGYGGEVVLGFRIAPRLWIEGAGGFTRTTARSEISDDVENAPSVTLEETMSRVSAEGAVRIDIADRGATVWFVRGGGGWMRELAGGNSLADDGFVFSAGGGVRHWFRENGSGAVKRIGLRLEGRLVMPTRGIEFGSRTVRLTPAGAGAVIFGF